MANTPANSRAVIRCEKAVDIDPAIAGADVDGTAIGRDAQLVQTPAGDQHAGGIDIVGTRDGHVSAPDDGEERVEPDERLHGE